MTPETLTTLIKTHGLLILFPLSVAEGPLVSALAGWLVKLGLLPLTGAYLVLVLGDLLGDALHYGLGRFGPRWLSPQWRARLGLNNSWLPQLFQLKGGRTLILAKLTHSLGFAALIGAGAARMPFGLFLWYNLLASLPKSAAFLLLGYGLGHVGGMIDTWVWRASLIGLTAAAALTVWLIHHRRRPA